MPGLTLLPNPAISKVKICFLADNPRYKSETPILVIPPAKPQPCEGTPPPPVRRNVCEDVEVESVRAWKEDLRLDVHGFQVVEHRSKFTALDTKEVCDAYKAENQGVLERVLGAEKVVTWGLRKRMPKQRAEGEVWDWRNEVEIEQPAVMAHCDFTYECGRVAVDKCLGSDVAQRYIDEGYRVRIINTWRPLVDVIEKQPLALCDPRSVKDENLVKCTRILAHEVGEITLLQHREGQKWYWLDAQTTEEPFIFCTWDSEDVRFPGVARHSPHVSFDCDNVREDAPPRFSVESRSVVITKD